MTLSGVRAVLIGTGAALRTPWWIGGARLERLVRGTVAGTRRSGNVGLAIRASRGTLRALARFPLSPWRNTCLYRSIAECLVLRAHLKPFRLSVAVTRDRTVDGPIVAHAWVDGPESIPMPDMTPLAFSDGPGMQRR